MIHTDHQERGFQIKHLGRKLHLVKGKPVAKEGGLAMSTIPHVFNYLNAVKKCRIC